MVKRQSVPLRKLKIVFCFGIAILLPLLFLFGAAFFDLIHLAIFMTECILKWDATSIVGGFAAGVMTITQA
jgi:hypothetical protein